ncbi:MAG: TauD/TfdA family dioxygenase [Acidimicrobiales bacterium]
MAQVSTIARRRAEGDFAAQLPDLIEPTWWTGRPAIDPARFTIDAGPKRAPGEPLVPDLDLAVEMKAMFDRVGLVHVTNTGLTELADMREVASLVLNREMKYAGGSNPRDSLAVNVYEVGAPLAAWLHYHHEMAYVGQSTSKLGFLGHKALPDRGATYVSDNVAATDALLATDFGRKLAERGVCYHRNLSDRDAFVDRLEIGVYNHWQKSFDTEDPDQAVERAAARGLVTEWGPDRLLQTRYYVSAFEYFAQLDRNLLYCSVADHGMWFDAWPLVQHLPYDQRPLHLTFGDDTEMSRDELRQFVELYDRFGIKIDWAVGDILLVCNYRFAHGRPAIHVGPGEDRELGVMLGERYDRIGDLADKW